MAPLLVTVPTEPVAKTPVKAKDLVGATVPVKPEAATPVSATDLL
jgi:hypothetical protein